MGTAAYLNVFGSIYRVLQDLKAQGYSIEDVPEKEEDLIKMVSAPTNTNQSMEFTVRVAEPDVTHWTSWRESTGECSGRPKAFGQHCAPQRGECYQIQVMLNCMLAHKSQPKPLL